MRTAECRTPTFMCVEGSKQRAKARKRKGWRKPYSHSRKAVSVRSLKRVIVQFQLMKRYLLQQCDTLSRSSVPGWPSICRGCNNMCCRIATAASIAMIDIEKRKENFKKVGAEGQPDSCPPGAQDISDAFDNILISVKLVCSRIAHPAVQRAAMDSEHLSGTANRTIGLCQDTANGLGS